MYTEADYTLFAKNSNAVFVEKSIINEFKNTNNYSWLETVVNTILAMEGRDAIKHKYIALTPDSTNYKLDIFSAAVDTTKPFPKKGEMPNLSFKRDEFSAQELLNKPRTLTVGRYLTSLLCSFSLYSPTIVKKLSDSLNGYRKFNSYDIQITKDVVDNYDSDTYASYGIGTLENSCMKHDNTLEYVRFYEEFGVELIVVYDEDGFVIGRSLLWTVYAKHPVNKKWLKGKYADRFYGTDGTIEALKYFARSQNFMYKGSYTSCDDPELVWFPIAGKYEEVEVKLVFKVPHSKVNDTDSVFPYFDTFKFYDPLYPGFSNICSDLSAAYPSFTSASGNRRMLTRQFTIETSVGKKREGVSLLDCAHLEEPLEALLPKDKCKCFSDYLVLSVYEPDSNFEPKGFVKDYAGRYIKKSESVKYNGSYAEAVRSYTDNGVVVPNKNVSGRIIKHDYLYISNSDGAHMNLLDLLGSYDIGLLKSALLTTPIINTIRKFKNEKDKK